MNLGRIFSEPKSRNWSSRTKTVGKCRLQAKAVETVVLLLVVAVTKVVEAVAAAIEAVLMAMLCQCNLESRSKILKEYRREDKEA